VTNNVQNQKGYAPELYFLMLYYIAPFIDTYNSVYAVFVILFIIF